MASIFASMQANLAAANPRPFEDRAEKCAAAMEAGPALEGQVPKKAQVAGAAAYGKCDSAPAMKKYASKKRDEAREIVEADELAHHLGALDALASKTAPGIATRKRIGQYGDTMRSRPEYTEKNIIAYIVATLHIFKNLEQVVSDVVNHPKCSCNPVEVSNINAMLARLRRQGVIGVEAQKKTITLERIAAVKNKKKRCKLLVAFFTGLRKSEALHCSGAAAGNKVY